MSDGRPNVLFLMTDQQRFDTIAALGNPHIFTPNFDRLAARGVAFTNAYSSTPVCVPARYNIRTGCEPATSGKFRDGQNADGLFFARIPGQPDEVEERCGPFLARRMGQLGYRTFGIGKFHSNVIHPDLGYERFLRAEENIADRDRDAYASFIEREYPAYAFLEQIHGERTDMYYVPQRSALPAAITYEGWAATRAVEEIARDGGRPFFGFVSFIGPHPPFAPPIPFNRMYNPDRMSDPIVGDVDVDHLDEHIPWHSYVVWSDDISAAQARALKARYYGEISYIDHCIGRILDALDRRPDAANTLVCFFSDHGDCLGDHHAWQKENYFEESCHIPFMVSWPERIAGGQRRDDLVALTDLFGLATGAADELELRDGLDVMGLLDGRVAPRDHYLGVFEWPGTIKFKCMVRRGPWKYVFIANGGREQLFNLDDDPHELRQRVHDQPAVAGSLRALAIDALSRPGADFALDDGDLREFLFTEPPRERVSQFDKSMGVDGFPEHPSDAYPD